jgi:hypothetical protein
LYQWRSNAAARRIAAWAGDRNVTLSFSFLSCELSGLPWLAQAESDIIVEHLLLPAMRREPEERVAVYAQALRGLTGLAPDPWARQRRLCWGHKGRAPVTRPWRRGPGC